MKNVVILTLAAMVVFLADRLAREENQRYALLLGMCAPKDPAGLLIDFACLDRTQTRTSWFWQVYAGITDPLAPVPLFE